MGSTQAAYPFASAPPATSQVYPLSEGDAGTAETVRAMCQLINAGSRNPTIVRVAQTIIGRAGVKEFNFEGERRAIYQWFRQNVRFVRDVEGKETLRSALETLWPAISGAGQGMGDCDCQTVAMLSLLKAVGQRVRIVTVATQPQAPDRFSHVFPEVRNERGQWVSMDTARRKPRYGAQPRSWFRRYGWDPETCQAVDLDNPAAAAQFSDDGDGTGLGALGIAQPVHRGWGLSGTRDNLRLLRRAGYPGRLGLGQIDVSQLTALAPVISSAATGTAQIIAASRASPSTIAPAAMAPSAQAGLFASSGLSTSISSIPSWVWLAGGGVLILFLLMRPR